MKKQIKTVSAFQVMFGFLDGTTQLVVWKCEDIFPPNPKTGKETPVDPKRVTDLAKDWKNDLGAHEFHISPIN